MNVHALLHVPFEGLGEIEPWLLRRGHRLTHTRLDLGGPLPDVETVDWLIVMGGPMSVHEHRHHPWLIQEKRFIGQAVARRKAVLGICLGAQLLADVLGAKVYQNLEKEIGWMPVNLTSAAAPFLGGGQASLDVFHWHGDTFDLPAGASLLARTEACAHQAFSHGPRIVGLQFHLEMNARGIAQMIGHGRDDLTPGACVQTEEQMLAHQPGAGATQALHRLLEHLEQAVS